MAPGPGADEALDCTGGADGESDGGVDAPPAHQGAVVPAGNAEPAFESLEWRREYRIRLREEDWRRRQDELIRQKHLTWEVARLEKVNRIAAAREAATQRVLEEGIREENEQVEREYRERCREMEIKRKRNEWEAKVAEEVVGRIEETRNAAEDRKEKLNAQKARLCDDERMAAQIRAENAATEAALNAKRDGCIAELECARHERGAERARLLQAEAQSAEDYRKVSRPLPCAAMHCALLLPESRAQAVHPDLAARREANLRKKEKQRNAREVTRTNKFAAREKSHGLLAKMTGTTERSLLLGERSIFQ